MAGREKTKKKAKAKVATEKVRKSPTRSRPSRQNIGEMNVANLLEAHPHLLDKRTSDKERFSEITPKQWEDYLKQLPCAVCGKTGGKCKCKPEDLIPEE